MIRNKTPVVSNSGPVRTRTITLCPSSVTHLDCPHLYPYLIALGLHHITLVVIGPSPSYSLVITEMVSSCAQLPLQGLLVREVAKR